MEIDQKKQSESFFMFAHKSRRFAIRHVSGKSDNFFRFREYLFAIRHDVLAQDIEFQADDLHQDETFFPAAFIMHILLEIRGDNTSQRLYHAS